MRQRSLISTLIGPATLIAASALVLSSSTTAHAQTPAAPAQPAPAQPAPTQPAPAQPAKKPDAKTTKAARAAYGEGQKAFEAGDYATAYAKFKEANDLIPAPHAEYWLALSLDRQNMLQETIAAYEAFLANPEASKVGAEQVASAETRLNELKGKLPGKLSIVTTPPGAQVSIDGTPVEGVAPVTSELPPGMHKVTVTLEGYEPQEVQVEVKANEEVEQKLQLMEVPEPVAAAPPPAPPPPAPPPPPPPPPERSMVPAYVTLGLAGAGLVTGTIFGIKALQEKKDFEDMPTTDRADDVERYALIADMSFGIAITLGVTGIVLLTSDAPAEAPTAASAEKSPLDKSRFSFAPYVGKKSGGAAASYTF